MILHCNFEELRALASGGEMVAQSARSQCGGGVAAPSEAVAHLEQLLPRLTGDLSITTLDEQEAVRKAVALICTSLKNRMDEKVVEEHPGHEEAVSLYFDYGYSRAVLDRVEGMGAEMAGMIELMTGESPTEQTRTTITFPD